MIKIDKDVPIPDRKHRGGSRCKYPWLEMEIGDSFFVENPSRDKRGFCIGMATSANRRYKTKRFDQRTEGTGLRIWRVE